MADDVQEEESNPAEALAILQAIGALETGDDGDVAVQSLVRQCLTLVDSAVPSITQSAGSPEASV